MNTIEYAQMADKEKNYWWHIGRLEIIRTYLQKFNPDSKDLKILNIGCGTGGTINLLQAYGDVDNVDISDEAIKYMNQNGYKNIIKVKDIRLPFKENTYDVIAAFDVLEHIEEQDLALKEWHRVLKKNGKIFITVPAYQWLWSEHDRSLQHKRRYTKRKLLTVVKTAGLDCDRISYAIVFSLPFIVVFLFLNRLMHKKTTPESSYVGLPKLLNKLFIYFLCLEAKAHKIISFPFGASVVGVLSHDADNL